MHCAPCWDAAFSYRQNACASSGRGRTIMQQRDAGTVLQAEQVALVAIRIRRPDRMRFSSTATECAPLCVGAFPSDFSARPEASTTDMTPSPLAQ